MELRPSLFPATLILFILSNGSIGGQSAALKMDQALITFQNLLTEEVHIYFTSDYCYKCVQQPLTSVKPNNSSSVVISTKFTVTMQAETKTRNNSFCRWSQTYGEGGHYLVNIRLSEVVDEPSCRQTIQTSPHNVYLPLLAAALILLFLSALVVAAPYIYRRRDTSKFLRAVCCRSPRYSVDKTEPPECDRPNSTRLQSLDTFRGFSLTIMVFVNYGGGGYWFFQHAPWNGLTVADLVMPWFVFIIGTSVVLAFDSMRRRGVTRTQLLRKVTWRTAVLLLLGFCFLNYSPRDGPLSWSWLRVPGVLQRLGFTYFVLSLLQIFWGLISVPLRTKPLQDLTLYWPQWLLIFLLESLWLCLTFLLPLPNCPTGYLGAGGIGDNGLFPNCTGGAAGLIDRWMFGDNMFRYPTCREMYQTTQPFDPEGVLGTINSIVMGFLGMQAGKIIIFYRGSNVDILGRFAVWAVLLGISAAILTKCTRDAGFIPVNKNLWSLSFVTCLGSFSFLLLGAMYFIIDVRGWWRGRPFIFPGGYAGMQAYILGVASLDLGSLMQVIVRLMSTNSILVYVGHSLLGFYFPFSWDMSARDSHWELLFMNLWGTSLWVLVSYLLYRKRFFLKI